MNRAKLLGYGCFMVVVLLALGLVAPEMVIPQTVGAGRVGGYGVASAHAHTQASEERPRARDIGLDIGIFLPGKWNAITDVAGVKVGHYTLIRGDSAAPFVPTQGPARTGVTVILPHDGNLFRQKVPAAAYVLNAFGKATGLQQVNELGNLEVPILLTNTLNVPLVADAVIQYMIRQSPEIGVTTGTVNPVVAEVNDGYLNDIQGRHVRAEHVFAAIARASSGPVEEGSVGAGTGSSAFGWKGGIGTASRVLPAKRGGYTIGVLVLTNFDGVLTVNGAPVGRELGKFAYSGDFPYEVPAGEEAGGSVIVVIATDAPLDHRNLYRLAKRAGLGLARTGFFSSNGSGDYFLAFSTARTVPHDGGLTEEISRLRNDPMSPLFLATVEATEEAVINALLKATDMDGREGRVRRAIAIRELVRVLKKYNSLDWHSRILPWGGPTGGQDR